jgi:hypothetical protein
MNPTWRSLETACFPFHGLEKLFGLDLLKRMAWLEVEYETICRW